MTTDPTFATDANALSPVQYGTALVRFDVVKGLATMEAADGPVPMQGDVSWAGLPRDSLTNVDTRPRLPGWAGVGFRAHGLAVRVLGAYAGNPGFGFDRPQSDSVVTALARIAAGFVAAYLSVDDDVSYRIGPLAPWLRPLVEPRRDETLPGPPDVDAPFALFQAPVILPRGEWRCWLQGRARGVVGAPDGRYTLLLRFEFYGRAVRIESDGMANAARLGDFEAGGDVQVGGSAGVSWASVAPSVADYRAPAPAWAVDLAFLMHHLATGALAAAESGNTDDLRGVHHDIDQWLDRWDGERRRAPVQPPRGSK